MRQGAIGSTGEETGGMIAVIDYGGQYAHLIARRVRSLGLFSRIFQPEGFHLSGEQSTVGVILSGGPRSVTDSDAHPLPFDPAGISVPVLGLCYGHQLLASAAGGQVSNDGRREYGTASVTCDTETLLFSGLVPQQKVWMSHGDHVDSVPAGFKVTASSNSVHIAGFESEDARLFGLQFHPEVTHTEHGMGILDNFLSLCTSDRDWNPDSLERTLTERILRQARGRKLFLLVSGGVDSLVSLVLCLNAVGPERVSCLHVDTGFMRKDESAEVMDHLTRLGFDNLHIVNASRLFFESLKNVVEPEEKRKIIGRLFVQVLNERIGAANLGDDWMLVQGTIYPDTIESGGSDKAALIKTHHNRVEEIERLLQAGRVIEPLNELYKDEVRVLGHSLGLPESLVERHPFPGPGLAIRILCSDGTSPRAGLSADSAPVRQLAAEYGLDARILPVKSVGVQGDSRTYHHPAVLWVRGGGAMDWEVLRSCATRLANRFGSVNRAMFSLSDLGEEPFRLRPVTMTREAVAVLQEIDALVRERLSGVEEIWQVPVVSLPLFDRDGNQAFVIRPVCSRDAMTADFHRMEPGLFAEICRDGTRIAGVGHLFYDLTAKPPGTIEWE